MRISTAAWLLLAATLAAGCGCSNGQNANGNSNAAGNGDGNGMSANSGINGGNTRPQIEVLLGNPWKSARIGDTAVYRTPQSDETGETWTLIDATTIEIVRRQGVDPFGEPLTDESAPPVPSDGWWTLPNVQRKKVPGEPVTLADGTELKTYVVTDGDVTWLISEQAPFDGVVRETQAGKDQPVRELVTFQRAEPPGTNNSSPGDNSGN